MKSRPAVLSHTIIGLMVTGLMIILAGCGGGYESDNRDVVAELPALDDVALVDEDHYGYCTADTCLLGNDRSGALLIYSVDTETYTQAELLEEYAQGLPDWNPTIDKRRDCADPADCDEVFFASFTRGDARIDVNLDNWPAGQYELHVDARGGG